MFFTLCVCTTDQDSKPSSGLHVPEVKYFALNYREVTIQLVQELPLTSKQKFRFGLAGGFAQAEW